MYCKITADLPLYSDIMAYSSKHSSVYAKPDSYAQGFALMLSEIGKFGTDQNVLTLSEFMHCLQIVCTNIVIYS